MSCRSISLVICMFVAVSLATLHRDPDSTEEWSTEESVRDVRQQSAGEELGELLDASDDAVVDLEAGDTKLVAHRELLAARSSVLADTLLDHMEHDNRGPLFFREMEGQTLRHLVGYLYTLRAPQLPPSKASQLMAAANEYGLPALQEACERQVAAQLSVETAAAAAVLAVKLSANHLRDAAVNFMLGHRIKVLATKGWADALQNHPKEAAVVSHLLADRLADICGPATMEIQNITTVQADTTVVTTQPLTEPSPTSVTAAPALASCPTSPLDEDAVSLLRELSKEERDHRLIQAAKEGTVADLRELLAAGADVGAREGTFYTALQFAAMKGHVEAASCLLEAGADVESKGWWRWTPLHEAAFWDQVAMLRMLLAANADPNARDEYGSTPLHVVARFGIPEAAAALLEGGADREIVNYAGNTPLDDARHRDYQQLIDILTRGQPVYGKYH